MINHITKTLLVSLVLYTSSLANTNYDKPLTIPTDNNTTIQVTGSIAISIQKD